MLPVALAKVYLVIGWSELSSPISGAHDERQHAESSLCHSALPSPTYSTPQVVINYAASAGASEDVAQKIKDMGSDALVIKANVGKREEIDAMFKEVTEKWGRVDVLVNNAGQCPSLLIEEWGGGAEDGGDLTGKWGALCVGQ